MPNNPVSLSTPSAARTKLHRPLSKSWPFRSTREAAWTGSSRTIQNPSTHKSSLVLSILQNFDGPSHTVPGKRSCIYWMTQDDQVGARRTTQVGLGCGQVGLTVETPRHSLKPDNFPFLLLAQRHILTTSINRIPRFRKPSPLVSDVSGTSEDA